MKKLFIAYNYLIYLIKSKNEHGVHSPFIFDLLMEVVYNRTDYYAYKKIEKIRAELLDSQQSVNCIDLGAGSLKNKGHKKSIKSLVHRSAKSAKFAQLLFRLVNYFQPSNVLELGTSLGISSAYMAMANSKIKVITIEGCEEIACIAEKNFRQLELKNIKQLHGSFDDILPSVLNEISKIEFVFFDGNHRKEPTLNYFHQCLEKAHENSIFIFDDIYWSPEMKEAWKQIKENARVTVTLDLFYLGIVFFRKEQVKQHFVISY